MKKHRWMVKFGVIRALMRKQLSDKLEWSRITTGPMASNSKYGMAGAFLLQGPCGEQLAIISSGSDDEYKWEHVSVSTKRRIPNWQEMCFVKELFWDEEETVMQLHPPKSTYVNYHPNCLHLWRPMDNDIPLPPPILVGPRRSEPTPHRS